MTISTQIVKQTFIQLFNKKPNMIDTSIYSMILTLLKVSICTDKSIKTKFLLNSWIKVYFTYNFSLYHIIGVTSYIN